MLEGLLKKKKTLENWSGCEKYPKEQNWEVYIKFSDGEGQGEQR